METSMNSPSAEEVWNELIEKARQVSERDLVSRDFNRLSKCATKGQVSNHLWSLWFFFRQKLLLDTDFDRYLQWLDNQIPSRENFTTWLLKEKGTKFLPRFWRKQN